MTNLKCNCKVLKHFIDFIIYKNTKVKIQTIIRICRLVCSNNIIIASEKGASCWLTSLPLQKWGFFLNKQEFHDAICLRYNSLSSWQPEFVPVVNPTLNSVNHCLTCKRGGYVIMRLNSIRDLFAELLS